ncbi:MAG: MBOAT family protein [Deltaproteobacteria bacterium]|nr:MBOAT family protein [Deltaproteobacteria bacterium]
MLFNSAQFAVFFTLLLLAYHVLPRRSRGGLLLGASLLFYFLWVPQYIVLLLADVAVNYLLLRRMVASKRPKLYLTISVSFTLLLLAYFKYAAFIVESLIPLSDALWGWQPPVPELILPLGISFFSFQLIALSVDTYNGRLEALPSFPRVLLFICFFPQLIAGPILRGNQFLPQLERGGVMTRERVRRGIWLIASGAAKKIVLADFFLKPYVDLIFSDPGAASAPVHLVALYGFAFQVYFDFSGYSDIARGLACLLGFELPLNFREPYLSRNAAEHWRRWHITLSTWLRDYVYAYLPLGGNRLGRSRAYLTLFITMLLGGLWHGAGWTFVIWGGLHGIYLIVHRACVRNPRHPEAPLALRDAPAIFGHFQVVCLLYILFRAPSLGEAWLFTQALFTKSYLVHWPILPTLIVLVCIGLHFGEYWLRPRLPRLQQTLADHSWGSALEGLALGSLAALVIAMGGVAGEFIYFQF